MSTEILREAAGLMRERAEAAMADLPEQRWKPGPTIDPDNHGWFVASDIPEADWDTTVARLPYDYDGHTATHIASWHPAVALAVADWLGECARLWEYGDVGPLMWKQANAVARAYLGRA